MKAKEFISVLRTLIREEVRAAVRQELKQALTENKILRSNTQQVRPSNSIKKYTGNPMLDEVLNETKLTSDFRQSPDVSEWPEMNYTTDNIPSMQQSSMMDLDINEDYEAPLPEMNSSLPFMKDYTKLMKRADEIAQQKQF